jgi:lysozyme
VAEPRSQPSKAPPLQPAAKGTLAAIVGAVAASVLFVAIPKEESGRTVQATISTNGAVAIKHVAGPQYLNAYLDLAGVATACDGITKGVRLGQRYTEAQCTALLERELVAHAERVMACTPALYEAGRDNQRAAAVLLAYNIGTGGWCGSTAAKRFNARQWRAGCDAFLAWDKARVNGVLRPVKGLTARRQRERAICLRGLQ